jgi:hypothetical protein
LRPEHVAIDGERLLIAEQPGEIGGTVLAFEAIITDYLATGRQATPLGGDALDMAPQFDLLCQEGGRAARYSALSLGIRTGLLRASSAAGVRLSVSIE